MVQEQTYPQSAPDYAALLQQYGEAMLRIGQLEAQVGHLTKRLQGGVEQGSDASGQAPVQESPGVRQLAEKVEALQKLVVDSSEKTPGSSADSQRHEDEIRQLRVQINSLASQLALAQGQLSEVRAHRPRHRSHRDKSGSKWQSLTGRLGLGKSDSR